MIIAVVCIASVDSAGVGQDDKLLLPKFGIVAIPDSLALVVLVLGAIYLTSFVRILSTLRSVRQTAIFCSILTIFGILRGFAVDLPHVYGIGPEARGLLFTCSIMAISSVVVVCRPERAMLLIKVLVGFAILRDTLEFFLYGALSDVSQGTLSAIGATVLQAYAVQARGRAWWLLLLAVPLDLFVLTSYRRTPLIELGLGVLLLLLTSVVSPKANSRTRFAAVALTLAVPTCAFIIDAKLLNGQLTDRLQSLDIDKSNQVATSNYEHRRDVEESLSLALKSPLMGYGSGTRLPGRYLTKYDDDVPIHSPHIHSWVRFGILGLFGYVFLQIAMLLRLTRVSLSRGHLLCFEFEYKSLLIGCAAYFWGQWALPPFYTSDYKQSLCVGLLLGLVFSLERINPRLQGRNHRRAQSVRNRSAALHSPQWADQPLT